MTCPSAIRRAPSRVKSANNFLISRFCHPLTCLLTLIVGESDAESVPKERFASFQRKKSSSTNEKMTIIRRNRLRNESLIVGYNFFFEHIQRQHCARSDVLGCDNNPSIVVIIFAAFELLKRPRDKRQDNRAKNNACEKSPNKWRGL